jgi:hypothetical protein
MSRDPGTDIVFWTIGTVLTLALIIAGALFFGSIILLVLAVVGIAKAISWYVSLPKKQPAVGDVVPAQLSQPVFPTAEDFLDAHLQRLFQNSTKSSAPCFAIYEEMARVAFALYAAEDLANPLPPIPSGDLIHQGRYQDMLSERATRTADPTLTLALINNALASSFNSLIGHLPPMARGTSTTANVDATSACTVPLIDILPDIGRVVFETITPYFSREIDDLRLFKALRRQLDVDAAEASGVSYPAPVDDLVMPYEHKGSPAEIVRAYLHDTPLEDLFYVQVPFAIPDHPYRFEHTFCLGPSGSGKTTLLQQIVLDDLAKPDPPAMVIIDPKGLMVERLQRLDVFNSDTGRLKDRLIIVDPTTDPPPALNMFHPADKWNRMYADNVRRQIENQTISTYSYIFSSLESALTQKQTVAFTFAVRLLFTMQTANIHTLIDFLDDPAKTLAQSKFRLHIERLDETSRRFFQNDYYSTSFGETRQQIKARLYSILQRPEFVAMFSTPERKLDMFDCLQKRKIVLVNTAMSVLGSEGSQLFGRYMIALTLNAAFERISLKNKNLWNPAFLIIDEFQLFADEIKTPELLRLAREYNLGVTIAVQDMHGRPFNDSLRNAISTNTSIKYAASPEGVDINYAARDLRCDPEFLRQQTKTATHARFACYVRGLTERAVSISVPFGNTDDQPQMTHTAHARLIELNRERLTVPPAQPAPVPQPVSPAPVPASVAPSPPPASPTSASAAVAPPPANDPDAGAHTDAAAKW